MNLTEAIGYLTGWDGYVKHILHGDPQPKPAADGSTATIKHHAFWFEVGDNIRECEVEIVVIDEGKGENEKAYIVSTDHLPNQPVVVMPFYGCVATKLDEIKVARPELASAHIIACDEDNCIAFVKVWKGIDDEPFKAEKEIYVFFLSATELTYGATPSLEESLADALAIIQGG